jgi:nitroreductase
MEKINAAQFDELIKTRRSIFTNQFEKDKKIPDEIIMQLLENANWAPNHKNTEPWRFVIFKEDGLKKLATFQSDLYKKTAGEKFKQVKYEKLLITPLECSHVIAICMKRSTEINIPEVEEIAAVACAVQNLYLSVTAHSLGGYWSTGGITYTSEAKSFFHLDEADKLLGFFYLGYVKVPPAKGFRKPVTEKITWVSE